MNCADLGAGFPLKARELERSSSSGGIAQIPDQDNPSVSMYRRHGIYSTC